MIRICLALALLSSPAALARPPVVSVEPPACIPRELNGLITARVEPEPAGIAVRLFFRWHDHGAFYFTDMVAMGGGHYWGLTARPQDGTRSLEVYVEVSEAGPISPQAPRGRILARSGPSLLVAVEEGCSNPLFSCTDGDLMPAEQLVCSRQLGAANNLVVGETAQAQEGQALLGFLCDGVVTRVNHQGIPRPDEVCRGCVVPWWLKERCEPSPRADGS